VSALDVDPPPPPLLDEDIETMLAGHFLCSSR
jgi:hypothetical protein